MKKTKKVVVGSLATIAVSCALIGGATLAYFTDEASTNIAITAGNVEIAATVKDDFKLWSMDEPQTETFANGGTVEYKDGELTIDRITPGDKVAFDIEVTNNSDVAIKYQTQLTATNALLLSGLDVTIDEEKLTAEGMVVVSAWKEVEAYADIDDIHVEIELPKEAGNEYKLQGCTLTVAVNAIQANGEASNLIEVGKNQYIANSAESLIAFAEGLKDGTIIANESTLVRLTITNDIDLSGYVWTPIHGGHMTIEGNNHTISNLNCGIDADGKSAFVTGYGLTISNLTLKNVTAAGTQAAAFLANGAEGGNLVNCTLAGTNSISFDRSASGEQYGGVGIFYGVIYSGDKATNLTIAEGAVVTINVAELEETLCYGPTTDYVLGYAVAEAHVPNAAKYAEVHNYGTIKTIETQIIVSDSQSLSEAFANADAKTEIKLEAGEYELPSTDAIPEGVSIVGSGADNTTVTVGTSGYAITSKNVTIKDVKIDGAKVQNTDYNATIKLNAGSLTLENVTVEGGALATWGAAILVQSKAESITVKNCKIGGRGAFRGILVESTSCNVIIEDCEIDSYAYTVNFDGGSGSLTVKNSKLHGWTSYGTACAGAYFENVEFTVGINNTYNYVRGYVDTTFKNCTFGTDFEFGAANQKLTVIFDGCTWTDGTPVTEDILEVGDNNNTTWQIK